MEEVWRDSKPRELKTKSFETSSLNLMFSGISLIPTVRTTQKLKKSVSFLITGA